MRRNIPHCGVCLFPRDGWRIACPLAECLYKSGKRYMYELQRGMYCMLLPSNAGEELWWAWGIRKRWQLQLCLFANTGSNNTKLEDTWVIYGPYAKWVNPVINPMISCQTQSHTCICTLHESNKARGTTINIWSLTLTDLLYACLCVSWMSSLESPSSPLVPSSWTEPSWSWWCTVSRVSGLQPTDVREIR